ncbi:MAG: class I adenylate-forming enzyme family protein, partial [Campylobacterota bacterium]|nr:class I adenylate-forming enzyme family protein [Campylobacterota bacterium]
LSYFDIKQGDRVSFLMNNDIFLPVAYLGCFRIGAIAVPSSYFSSSQELIRESNSCEPKIYFTTKECYPKFHNLKEHAKSVQNIVVIDAQTLKNDLKLSDIYQKIDTKYQNFTPIDLDENTPAMILYTSGSTGKPKGIIYTHKSLFANAKNRSETLNHNSLDTMFTPSYLSHGAATTVVLLPMLFCGGTTVLTAKHNIDSIVEIVEKNKVTHMLSSPIDWRDIVEKLHSKPHYFSSLKFASTGGDAIAPDIQEKFKHLTGLPLNSSLGMTECGGYMTTPPDIPSKDGSIGKPLNNVEVRVIDENDNGVQNLEIGELIVKSDMVMPYYFNDIENTQKAFVDGWFKTGDLVYRDEDGYYFFKGRKKNVIVRDTGNINPQEVEYALLKHPKIENAIVMGVKNELRGQDILAFLIPSDIKNHPTQKELNDFLKEWIAQRKIPQYLIFMKSFPSQTTIGKVNMKELKKIAIEFIQKEEDANKSL